MLSTVALYPSQLGGPDCLTASFARDELFCHGSVGQSQPRDLHKGPEIQGISDMQKPGPGRIREVASSNAAEVDASGRGFCA